MGKVSVRFRMLLKKQTKKYYNNLDYKVNLNNYDLVFKFKIIQLKNKEKIKRLKQFWFLTLKKIFFSNRLQIFLLFKTVSRMFKVRFINLFKYFYFI
jgi:hypothetical protein